MCMALLNFLDYLQISYDIDLTFVQLIKDWIDQGYDDPVFIWECSKVLIFCPQLQNFLK